MTDSPRRRHRGRRALIAILVVLVVLVVLFFVADYFAKKYAESYVQTQVATALGLPSTTPVSVNLGSGSILLQAASGSIKNVDVAVNPLVIDGFAGSATLAAQGVPLSSTSPVQQLSVQITVPDTTITKAIMQVPTLKAFTPKVTVAGQVVKVTGVVSILGLVQHIGVTATPHVRAGVPGLQIKTATFDGATISVEALDHYIPGLAGVLRSSTSLCIANDLPRSFVLTAITIQGQSLVSTFSGDGIELNSASLSERGTC